MDENLAKSFASKFQTKTKSELQNIISNPKDYQTEAVFAAKWLLKKKKYKGERDSPKTTPQSQNDPAFLEEYGIIQAINKKFKSYTSSYQLSDFLTIVALAFLCSTIIALINYYSAERWLRDIVGSVRFTFHIIFLLSLHIVYKVENGTGNTFLGRVLNDVQYIIIVISISTIYNWLHLVGWNIQFDESVPFYIGILIGVIGILFFWEGLVSFVIWILKAIFKKSPL